MLFDDGNYQSSETPAQKINLRVRDKLPQTIDRERLSHPLVNDGEMPDATAEQARVCTLPKVVDGSRFSLCAKPRPTRHAQIEDVAKWLAKMGRRADWMSNDMRSGASIDIAKALKDWEKKRKEPKETDKLDARKHRLMALFRSPHCYSANVHACRYGLGDLVTSLVRLDRLPPRNPAEGLKLLAQAWDEHRSTHKKIGPIGTARASHTTAFCMAC